MRQTAILVLVILLAGCSASDRQASLSIPEAAVRMALPDAWVILRVEVDTYPSYRPEGKGKAIFLGLKDKKYLKQQHSAVLFIMPPDYQDGGDDPTGGQAQSWPARLIATTEEAKLYLWPGSQAENWETMEKDLLNVLIE